jgi:hypothetical protein
LLSLAALVIVGAIVLMFIIAQPKKQAAPVAVVCFEQRDLDTLLALVGESAEDAPVSLTEVQALEGLYTVPIMFTENLSQYESDEAGSIISSLGSFYKDTQGRSSFTILLRNSYHEGESPELASQRLQAVKNDLMTAGIPEDRITIEQPQSYSGEDDTDGFPVYLDIIPTPTCN